MTWDLKSTFPINATLVANAFIDHHMAGASGEYVKIYLYLLRHQDEQPDLAAVAEDLHYTEGDVRRAIAYWEKIGVLVRRQAGKSAEECTAGREQGWSEQGQSGAPSGMAGDPARRAAGTGVTEGRGAAERGTAGTEGALGIRTSGAEARDIEVRDTKIRDIEVKDIGERDIEVRDIEVGSIEAARMRAARAAAETEISRSGAGTAARAGQGAGGKTAVWTGQGAGGEIAVRADQGVGRETAAPLQGAKRTAQSEEAPGPGRLPAEAAKRPVPVHSQEQVSRLADDEDFAQLLYIAQKYMNKVFTQRECQVFAYLYGELKITSELLEYLVEYCVQNGHTSIRYMETVALNWHQRGLVTVEEAKAYCAGFSKDGFAVMKAFGLNDRRPAEAERRFIEEWFGTYGFTREIVLEACDRTIRKTHSPSFEYADKILRGWKEAGVKSLSDVEDLDMIYQKQEKDRTAKKGDPGQGGKGKRDGSEKGKKSGAANRFHNFEQSATDYDSLMMEKVRARMKK